MHFSCYPVHSTPIASIFFLLKLNIFLCIHIYILYYCCRFAVLLLSILKHVQFISAPFLFHRMYVYVAVATVVITAGAAACSYRSLYLFHFNHSIVFHEIYFLFLHFFLSWLLSWLTIVAAAAAVVLAALVVAVVLFSFAFCFLPISDVAASRDLNDYVITEKWRDVEQALPGDTKILPIWMAWGSLQYEVWGIYLLIV